ncbi:hypothetical protein LCGC14_1558590 [marine sediment metagenome]|uniref:Uncharacterized protein n=1 Tax=marine sediment metagenome TaxID=412755 RepID=A0A0F9J981_9ZZZZ
MSSYKEVDLQNLIPEIEIGRKYLFIPRLIESTCPHCGKNDGKAESSDGTPFEVRVIDTAKDFKETTYCDNCKKPTDSGQKEGWYAVQRLSPPFDYGSVPYTQLEEIKEEVSL